MSRFFTSYKPSLPYPSREDAFFARDEDEAGDMLVGAEDRAAMVSLAGALLQAEPDVHSADYSIITNEGMPGFNLIRLSCQRSGHLEITIYKDRIEYEINEQYDYRLFEVIDRCTIAARTLAGYFVYCYDYWAPYDPLDETTNYARALALMTRHAEQQPAAAGKARPLRAYWRKAFRLAIAYLIIGNAAGLLFMHNGYRFSATIVLAPYMLIAGSSAFAGWNGWSFLLEALVFALSLPLFFLLIALFYRLKELLLKRR